MDRYLRDMRRMIEREGFEILRVDGGGNRHYKFRIKFEQHEFTLVTSASPSDYRYHFKVESTLRKFIRQARPACVSL